MINPKRIPIIVLLTFGVWFFFWIPVECWLAQSLEPLLSSQWYQFSFIIGCISVFIVIRYGKKLII